MCRYMLDEYQPHCMTGVPLYEADRFHPESHRLAAKSGTEEQRTKRWLAGAGLPLQADRWSSRFPAQERPSQRGPGRRPLRRSRVSRLG